MTRIPMTLPPPYTSISSRARSLRSNADSFTSTSELLVGPKSTRFLLHTSLLTSESPYFRAALTGAFLESTSQSIRLADVSVDTFELLVCWLYTGAIDAPFKDAKPAYYTLLHLYILADRFCFEKLRNYIVDLMADLADSTNSVLTPSDTRILYDHIDEGSRLRQLVLDLFAFKKTDKLIATHTDRWHAGFLRDLCVRLKRPCTQAMLRHRLHRFLPMSWHGTRACENCRVVLPPRLGAVGCDECCYAWCLRCFEEGLGMAGWEDGRGAAAAAMLAPMGPLGLGEGDYEVVDGRVVRRRGADAHGHGHGHGHGHVPPSSSAGANAASLPGASSQCYARKWESCKPWRGSRCAIYHEHRETEACVEAFLGR